MDLIVPHDIAVRIVVVPLKLSEFTLSQFAAALKTSTLSSLTELQVHHGFA